jgi:L-rhamnose mutarotase
MVRTNKLVLILLLVGVVFLVGCGQPKVKRIGMVVGLRPEKMGEYKAVHADSHAGVRDLLSKYHMEKFSIYLHQIEGKWYEFGYYEYTGDDYDGDMAAMGEEPRIKKWLSMTDPMQMPLSGENSWSIMEQVYYNE